MNTLIVYAGKTGTTEKCAKILKALLDDSVLCDLTKQQPDLTDYGCIVVGGSIRMGKIHSDVRKFLEKNRETLMQKKCGYFICNCFMDQTKAYFKNNIPAELLSKALVCSSFGGELNVDKYKGLDKLVMKAIGSHLDNSESAQLYTSSEAIQKFAERVRKR